MSDHEIGGRNRPSLIPAGRPRAPAYRPHAETPSPDAATGPERRTAVHSSAQAPGSADSPARNAAEPASAPDAAGRHGHERGTADTLNDRHAPEPGNADGPGETDPRGPSGSGRQDQRQERARPGQRAASGQRASAPETSGPSEPSTSHARKNEAAPRGASTDAPPTGAQADSASSANVDGAPLTKRKRRRRRKAGKNAAAPPAARVDAPADTAVNEPPADAPARPKPGRKPRRRRSRRFAGASGQAAPAHADAGSPAAPLSQPASRPAANDHVAPTVPAAPMPPPVRRAPVYAALDLGTNNCRLLIAIPTRPGQFRVIDAFSRIVRLGEGLSRTGSLSRGAMDRAIAALAICAQKLSARDVVRCRLIATEACRAAANGAEFIEQVARETGLELEIVSRETEARLAVSGCGSLIERSARGAVLFDIGGGSSEIALLDLRGRDTRRLSKQIVAWTSLPVGVVTLAERHGGRDVTPEIFEAMIQETVEMIRGFKGRDKLGALVGTDRFHLLGTSGTVTTLAGVHLKLERYDRRQVDGLWLTDLEADELVARIAGWSFEERIANPCIGSDRADLVLAGCAILQAIRRVWPAPTLRVADRGLREGLLMEMMVADGVWRRRDPTRNTGT